MTKSYYRRFLDVVVTIGIVITLQWFLYPMVEYNSIVQRSKDENRLRDTYYVEGR